MSKVTKEELDKFWKSTSKRIFVDISIEELQELIEKNTPMKPKINKRYCGNCDAVRLLPYDNYCSNCGQKIDWSDYE